MVSLIKKDFYLNFIYIAIVIICVPILYILNLNSFFIYFGIIMGFLFNGFYYDKLSGTNKTLASLPIKRTTIVLSRYIFAFGLASFSFAYLWIIDMIAHAHLPYLDMPPMTQFSLISQLLIGFILLAVSFPIYYKFGYIKAIVIQILLLMVGTPAIGFIFAYSLTKIDSAKTAEIVFSILDTVYKNPHIFAGTITILLILASFALSKRIFQKKDLHLS
ncbi:ABC-2 transporter permease [Cytobacillus purgationiresistens]|uniref:ABC-type transport system involved in multi-copper enzyme maturation permease subunit n=1 Tax=Cytobacillus purgationiresistens TaxID=863449 RepID=A0ABU0AIP2_9BACI|nr:ABC-2 transporter permease [Cytobacillus purgationiresistens]MDQ0270900.1 ABC-type transport system involved in multi-copper enzyme maturation permease subunit [Cytobacillus purgationiresistens]